MALWQYASTEETTNSCRVSRVLIDPCTDQIRDVLRHHIPPANFPQVIRQQKHKLPKLTKPQFDLILPRSGHYTGNYSDFDISLLYTLLRNICNIPAHSKGWGKDPDPIDMSLSANIERIRNARNTAVGHMTSSSLSNADFNYIWSSIRKVVVEIDKFLNNNQKYEKAVDDLRNETMDPEKDKEFECQLRDQVEEDTETRKMIKETNKTYKDHKERFEQFKNDSTARQDTTDAELHYVKHKIDEFESKTVTLQDQQDDMKIDIENLKQLTEAKEPLQNEEPNVARLKERLMEEALQIPLSEITEDSDKLPIEHLFSSVVIREDIKKKHEGRRAPQATANKEGKELKSPEDMLTKNGKPVPHVFMLGKAAHGKTTYCKWLLKTWCKTKGLGVGGRPLNKWEEGLSHFDFVFRVPLRNVDRSRANVTEMICQDILGSDTDLKATAQHVLSSKKYRCFIMLDGLDEWKPNQSVIDHLKYKGMPNIDCMSNCVIFTTMRPWKFSEVAGVLRNNARVIEIQGLDDKGIESVIERVLVYYYKLEYDPIEYKAKYEEIIQKLENATLKSFIKIPLLAVVCVQIWYELEQVGDTMTSFYIAMVNMLIERAHLKHDIQKLIFEAIDFSLPNVMTGKKNLKDYFNVLLKLGKVAYEGLLSKKMKLVFQKDDLETEIGEKELQFALDVGLISQRDEHSALEKKVSVQFFHKSVQEFLAAIYIVTIKEVSDSFCENLCFTLQILQLSNVIMFVCGICPKLGCAISQHVVRVADRATEICGYRLMSINDDPLYKPVAESLYEQQVNWYRELQYRHTDGSVKFHISDVFLSYYRDREIVRLTREILSDRHVIGIRSLMLDKIPTVGEHGITNTVINNFLSNNQHTRSLLKVEINGEDTGRCINIINGPALHSLYLYNIIVPDSGTVHCPVLLNCNKLKYLTLTKVPLADREIGLTSSMSMLERISLVRVNMTQPGWGRWLQSVIDINHQFDVLLSGTNIDKDTRYTINRSPLFSLQNKKDLFPESFEGEINDDWLQFIRVQSQAQDIHSMSSLESLSHFSQRQNEYDRPEFTRLRKHIHDTSIDRLSRSSLQSSSHLSERESDYDWLDFTRGHSQTPESDTRCCSYTCILL